MNPSRILYLLALLPLVGVVVFASLRPLKVLPRIRLAPGFAMTDAQGARVSSDDMRGKITLYNFGAARCQPDCAVVDGLVSAVESRLEETPSEIPVAVATIVIDGQLDRHAERLKASDRLLLTAGPEQVKLVVGGGFETYYVTNEQGVVEMEPSLMLVDGLGVLRASYRAPLPSADTLLRDIDLLVQEARNSQGLTRYAYEAAHLFLCYP